MKIPSLDSMSVKEKLHMMELIWNDLCTRAGDIASPEWHGEVLANREAALRDGTETVENWDSAKRKILKDIS